MQVTAGKRTLLESSFLSFFFFLISFLVIGMQIPDFSRYRVGHGAASAFASLKEGAALTAQHPAGGKGKGTAREGSE